MGNSWQESIRENTGAPTWQEGIRRAFGDNTHYVSSGGDLQSAVDAAIAGGASISNPQTIIISQGATPRMYETHNGKPNADCALFAWIAGTVGTPRYFTTGISFVNNNGYNYECLISHSNNGTSSFATDLAAGKWAAFTPGVPLSNYGITLEYASTAYKVPSSNRKRPAVPLSRKKMTVCVIVDDGAPSWFVREEDTTKYGGIQTGLQENVSTNLVNAIPLGYAIWSGIPVTLACIGDPSYGVASGDQKMTAAQLAQCITHGGFELAAHSMSHDNSKQPITAQLVQDEICAVKSRIESYRLGTGWSASITAHPTAGTYLINVNGNTSTHAIAWNAAAPTIAAAVQASLTDVGLTGPTYTVAVLGGPMPYANFDYGSSFIINIGDGTSGVTLEMDQTSLVGGQFTFAPLTPFSHPSVRGFVYPGTWNAQMMGKVLNWSDSNMIERIVARNYDWSRNISVYQPSYPLDSPYDNAVAFSYNFDTGAGTTSTILNNDWADANILPGTLCVVYFHKLTGQTTPMFKTFMDKLATLQEAGKIECVTASTAFNAYMVDSIPSIPGGDFDAAFPSALANQFITLSSTSNFEIVTATDPSLWDNVSKKWLHWKAGASQVNLALPVLIPGRTHTLQYTVYGTTVGNQWLEHSITMGGAQKYSTRYSTYNALDADNCVMYDILSATSRRLPASGNAKIITLKVFVPDTLSIANVVNISIKQRNSNADIQITGIKWFVG